MRSFERFTIASILLFFASSAVCAQDEPWDGLKKITWDRTYSVIKRDHQCVKGGITGVTTRNLTMRLSHWSDKNQVTHENITIERADILWIGQWSNAIDVVYSGRSSWADVKVLVDVYQSEHALIVLKNGKRRKGKPAAISNEGLTLRGESNADQILKRDIAKVYYVRVKPLSAGSDYWAQEMGSLYVLDPHQWPYLLHIAPKISVLLYDASQSEDNTELKCAGKR